MTTVSASERTAVALPKRKLLEKLTVEELRDGIDRCEIPVRDHRTRNKKDLVDALAKRGWVEIWQIPPGLSQDRLKKLCRAFGLDDSGRRKADLAARLGQPVLSVKQSFAWAIISGGKDVENRDRSTKFRGRLWIHAGKARDEEDVDKMVRKAAAEKDVKPARIRARYERERVFGKVIGSVELVDVVTESDSRWFGGEYGYVLRKPVRLAEPIDLPGSQGIFSAAGLPPLP